MTTCVIVADGTRARFITVEVPEAAELEGGPRLVEHEDYVNPEGQLPERQLFSDRNGRSHGSPDGSAHGLDDHREQHVVELERRFARRVVEAAARFSAEHESRRLVLVAGPRLLGMLRLEMAGVRFDGVEVVEMPGDLSGRSLTQIHQALASHGIAKEARVSPGMVYRPRGQEPTAR